MRSSPNITSWNTLQPRLRWLARWRARKQSSAREEGLPRLEFVFEDGDLGRGKLAERVNVLTGVMPTFRLKKDSLQVKAFTPLQAR